MTIKLLTIGVYGFDEEEYFKALQEAQVDTFCDIRWRRGVRGSRYAFANSQRLQKRLAELGIRYLHQREYAPSPEIRAVQAEIDEANKTGKRQRTLLSTPFITAYEASCLADFDAAHWLSSLPEEAAVVALFCVEREPSACHRSLLAARLQNDLGLQVDHLMP